MNNKEAIKYLSTAVFSPLDADHEESFTAYELAKAALMSAHERDTNKMAENKASNKKQRPIIHGDRLDGELKEVRAGTSRKNWTTKRWKL